MWPLLQGFTPLWHQIWFPAKVIRGNIEFGSLKALSRGRNATLTLTLEISATGSSFSEVFPSSLCCCAQRLVAEIKLAYHDLDMSRLLFLLTSNSCCQSYMVSLHSSRKSSLILVQETQSPVTFCIRPQALSSWGKVLWHGTVHSSFFGWKRWLAPQHGAHGMVSCCVEYSGCWFHTFCEEPTISNHIQPYPTISNHIQP